MRLKNSSNISEFRTECAVVSANIVQTFHQQATRVPAKLEGRCRNLMHLCGCATAPWQVVDEKSIVCFDRVQTSLHLDLMNLQSSNQRAHDTGEVSYDDIGFWCWHLIAVRFRRQALQFNSSNSMATTLLSVIGVHRDLAGAGAGALLPDEYSLQFAKLSTKA